MFLTKLKTKFLKPYYAEMSECARKTALVVRFQVNLKTSLIACFSLLPQK